MPRSYLRHHAKANRLEAFGLNDDSQFSSLAGRNPHDRSRDVGVPSEQRGAVIVDSSVTDQESLVHQVTSVVTATPQTSPACQRLQEYGSSDGANRVVVGSVDVETLGGLDDSSVLCESVTALTVAPVQIVAMSDTAVIESTGLGAGSHVILVGSPDRDCEKACTCAIVPDDSQVDERFQRQHAGTVNHSHDQDNARQGVELEISSATDELYESGSSARRTVIPTNVIRDLVFADDDTNGFLTFPCLDSSETDHASVAIMLLVAGIAPVKEGITHGIFTHVVADWLIDGDENRTYAIACGASGRSSNVAVRTAFAVCFAAFSETVYHSTPSRITNHRNHEQLADLALATVPASANRTVANAKTASGILNGAVYHSCIHTTDSAVCDHIDGGSVTSVNDWICNRQPDLTPAQPIVQHVDTIYSNSIDCPAVRTATSQVLEMAATADTSDVVVVTGASDFADTFQDCCTVTISDPVLVQRDDVGFQTGQDRGLTNLDVTLTYLSADGVANSIDAEFLLTGTSGSFGVYTFANLPGGHFVLTVNAVKPESLSRRWLMRTENQATHIKADRVHDAGEQETDDRVVLPVRATPTRSGLLATPTAMEVTYRIDKPTARSVVATRHEAPTRVDRVATCEVDATVDGAGHSNIMVANRSHISVRYRGFAIDEAAIWECNWHDEPASPSADQVALPIVTEAMVRFMAAEVDHIGLTGPLTNTVVWAAPPQGATTICNGNHVPGCQTTEFAVPSAGSVLGQSVQYTHTGDVGRADADVGSQLAARAMTVMADIPLDLASRLADPVTFSSFVLLPQPTKPSDVGEAPRRVMVAIHGAHVRRLQPTFASRSFDTDTASLSMSVI